MTPKFGVEEQIVAKGLNRAQLLGNVGRDPEMKSTQGGTLVANFSLATADRVKGADGNWTDCSEWHNCVAFGRTAEIVRDYVGKGSKLFIEGKIQTRSWDDKQSGKKVYRTEIIVNDLTLLDGKPQAEGGRSTGSSSGSYGAGARQYAGKATQSYGGRGDADEGNYASDTITDDDIPF